LDFLEILSPGVTIGREVLTSKRDVIKAWPSQTGSSFTWITPFLHIPAFNSDHNPISLNTNNHSFYLPRPFRFEEFWTKDPSCGKLIATTWNSPVLGNPSIYLPKKLNLTKAALLKWNACHFGNIQRNIRATLLQLDQT
jgi:hypothetical protein